MLYSRGSANPQALAAELLARHNVERRQAGVAALAWDPALAEGAQAYANELARLNLLRHSPKAARRGHRRKSVDGNARLFSPGADGRRTGRPNARCSARRTFPTVSTTGNWADVGHYTQIIWPGTQRVGCAIGKSARADVLVCRYWPAGNVDGQRVP